MNWKKMLVFGIVGLFSLGLTACSTSPSTTSSAKKNVTNNQTSLEKYRTVITTDGEVDDMKSGDTFHIILEVQDDGSHTLKAYQRVVVTVK